MWITLCHITPLPGPCAVTALPWSVLVGLTKRQGCRNDILCPGHRHDPSVPLAQPHFLRPPSPPRKPTLPFHDVADLGTRLPGATRAFRSWAPDNQTIYSLLLGLFYVAPQPPPHRTAPQVSLARRTTSAFLWVTACAGAAGPSSTLGEPWADGKANLAPLEVAWG